MGKVTEKLVLNKSANKVVDVPCAQCNRPTKHKILASADIQGEELFPPHGSVEYWLQHQVIQCQGCEQISYRTVTGNSEDFDVSEFGEWTANETVQLFPTRSAGRNQMKDAHLFPPNVQRIYEETIGAMNNDQTILAGIGIRALIETLCRDKKATGRNLMEQIDDLTKQGVLTTDGAAILHKLRTLGNTAAHEVKPHTQKQLGLALDVVEHLLMGVYVLPARASSTFK
jgi:hypothetical protein